MTELSRSRFCTATLCQNDELRLRFQREARMLAEIDSIYVTRLYEISEADGYFFLVQELVNGQSLAAYMKSSGLLCEREAIGITVDVATALTKLHELGIVHRDVKPENILLCSAGDNVNGTTIAKLADFGIARQQHSSEFVTLTAAESMLGTPLYMSPEHFYGGSQVSHQSDLYSLGATLFHALAGQPPFQADTALALADAHRHAPAPNPQTVNALLSDGVCGVINKSLQKRLDLRYGSAVEFLNDLLHLQRGEATSVTSHPLLPVGDSGHTAAFCFSWDLNCTPEELWPFVANTERLNRAINLPAVEYSIEQTESGGRRRIAEVRFARMRMQWQEQMFEWVEAQRMSVLREFQRGPVRWLTSIVELNRRADGGTTLTHSFRANCRHLPGLLFARFQMHAVTKRALDRVYLRIDSVAGRRETSDAFLDAFEVTPVLKKRSGFVLEQMIDRLSRYPLDRTAILKVTDYVRSASAQDVSHIRPRCLARKLQLRPDSVIEVCLYGVHEGLFDLSWDVICPSCRIAAQSLDAMENIRSHARCEACDFEFEVDFASSVEMILRTNSQIRRPETGKFCIGGPAHSPHVVAQVRVAAHETVSLGLELAEGRYVLRGPQLPFSIQMNVATSAQQDRLFVDITLPSSRQTSIELRAGRQLITLSNSGSREILLRIERSMVADDAVTALQAAGIPFFRNFFPRQIPSPQQVASVQYLTFVVVTNSFACEMESCHGEFVACELREHHLEQLVGLASRFGGTFVRPFDEGGLLVFRKLEAALQAVMQVVETIPLVNGMKAWEPVIALYQGSVMVTTINGQLEYLGSALRAIAKLTSCGRPSLITTTREVAVKLDSAVFELVEQEHEPENADATSHDPAQAISVVRFRQVLQSDD
ncbi:MAG: protein kinase [Planctomycetaceae bacterium]